ncbi:hypothetical protein [Arthrobacter sp. YN]|uniref:hypothetical protein n=1 Tax=Arthrobacter sp. YN TaxID=2020486 RepID=UPI000B5E8366|nr:hypothetical protein [Arthrobacter sp. YN]ASN20109.1 hypothetical protein CGK93_10835 [Arthrobacter sp. YN]
MRERINPFALLGSASRSLADQIEAKTVAGQNHFGTASPRSTWPTTEVTLDVDASVPILGR